MDTSKLAADPFYKGAEAELSSLTVNSYSVVVKHRVAKKYRNPVLDKRIRKERTLTESFILHEAKKAGVRVPSIIGIEPEIDTIIMTRIDGPVLRDRLDGMSWKEANAVFELLGEQIGRLHSAGIVHGDLTTSNVILSTPNTPFLVDFGMARHSVEPEDRGVDLHLFQRSLTASHTQNIGSIEKHLLKGYRHGAGEKTAKTTLAKTREIARRGRYFAIR
jgi:TP53 regulating kinase and related kinases